jgi:hypothetical protein
LSPLRTLAFSNGVAQQYELTDPERAQPRSGYRPRQLLTQLAGLFPYFVVNILPLNPCKYKTFLDLEDGDMMAQRMARTADLQAWRGDGGHGSTFPPFEAGQWQTHLL